MAHRVKKQIPPLRCGMTNKRTGNGKNKKNRQQQRQRQMRGFFPFDKLRVRMTTVGGDLF
jgi:hypothetical protein